MSSDSKTLLVQNRIQADIILPRPSLDNPPKTCLPMGGTMLADSYLIDALAGKIVVLMEHPALTKCYAGRVTLSAAQQGGSAACASKQSLGAFVSAWITEYGSSFVKAKDLRKLSALHYPLLLGGAEISTHQACVNIGKNLAILALDRTQWQIRTRHRSHRKEYALANLRAQP